MRAEFPRAGRRVSRRYLAATIGVVVGLVILGGAGSSFYTELLWFRETGYDEVFWTQTWTKVGLGALFGAIFAVALLGNLWIVRKITNPARLFTVSDQVLERYRATLQPYTKWIAVGGSLLLGLFAGSGASVKWREWLLFSNGVDFGQADPVFGKDIGFYVFRLPFHQFLFAWAFSSLVVITLIVAFAHYFMGGIRPQVRGDRVAPEVRAHLSVLFGALVLWKAWGYRLDQFGLLYSPRGTVTGASYTDVNAELPALRLLVVIAVICAAFFFVNAKIKNWILPLGGIGLLLLTSILAGGAYPAVIQRFRVSPNERVLEAPYIKRNIVASREAFGVSDVEVKSFPARAELSARDIQRNAPTIENVRLWDPFVLVDSYVQLQRIRQYYEFLGGADVDRYTFRGKRRQVMLAAREISPSGLSADAQTWVNRHLYYTHGYGVAMSLVNRVTREGQPDFVVGNIPPASDEGAPRLEQARIYYGEAEEVPFVVVRTSQEELDYPLTAEATSTEVQTTRYEGRGGIPLKSFFRRAAFAWRFRDVNLLISSALTNDSRIMFRRRIDQRLRHVAPFLRLDGDPYIAVIDGRLQWIVDAYTTTDMYPYAQRIDLNQATRGLVAGRANYIRNSVKFVVDTEDGTMTPYAWDEQDPVLRAWRKVFPGLIRPRSEMPRALLEHVRYPEALFMVQTDRYATYHITDPGAFYQKEDAWQVANDPSAQTITGLPIPPYYVLMRLPGERDADFVLVRPFTPSKRQNMTAYMVAHSDPESYGRLVAYGFPRSEAIFGPEQIQARINSDPAFSSQRSLWDQAGSVVIPGNILIIPIEKSLLYVQPIYLRGTGSTLPELKRVIAVHGGTIRMGETLSEALAAILGRAPPAEVEPVAAGEDVAALLREAQEHFRLADEALRRGDIEEFGRQYRQGKDALERASRESGSPSPTPGP